MHDLLHFDLSGPGGEDEILIQIGDGPLMRVRGPVTIGWSVAPGQASFAAMLQPKDDEPPARTTMIGGQAYRLLPPGEASEFIKAKGTPIAWRYPKE